jgi:hypothetical protein
MFGTKPFTRTEILARTAAETYHALARDYAGRGDTLNALSCCIEASQRLGIIPRPLAVKDQLVDLVRQLDPDHRLGLSIRRCMLYAEPDLTHSGDVPSRHKFLEQLVSAHQLLNYPSDNMRFNTAYETDRLQLRRCPELPELYVVQYTSGLLSSVNDPYFVAVAATLISHRVPHYLTGICAVVRQ